MAGLYIHIPFCRSRCIYCDFYSTTLDTQWQLPYVDAIRRELELRVPNYEFKTLYIGGGTPSQLTSEALHRLFSSVYQYVTLATDAEVTIEANPDDVTHEWIEQLKETPVNRISMGVQSFHDATLQLLRRRHNAQQAQQATKLLHEAGYTNLSLDLIYGLPNQTLEQFTDDVRTALSLGIKHLSAYALQFESGTPLHTMLERGEIHEADEQLSLDCYNALIDITADAGMEHYEISNFAKPGFRSRHNSAYWTDTPYTGLGAGAHSYNPVAAIRRANCDNIKEYINSLSRGELPTTEEHLTEEERYDERIMLSLRTKEGLSLQNLLRDFGQERLDYCLKMTQSHISNGLLRKTADEALCLTRRGLFVSDSIIRDLML